jgi:hypothetical protein
MAVLLEFLLCWLLYSTIDNFAGTKGTVCPLLETLVWKVFTTGGIHEQVLWSKSSTTTSPAVTPHVYEINTFVVDCLKTKFYNKTACCFVIKTTYFKILLGYNIYSNRCHSMVKTILYRYESRREEIGGFSSSSGNIPGMPQIPQSSW